MSLDPAALAELRARHLDFVARRLDGPDAEHLFRANVAAAFAALLEAPLGDVAPADRAADALERLASERAFEAIVRPVARALLDVGLAELAAEDGALGDRVPGPAKARIERLAVHHGLVPERLIREVCAQDAAQEVMREVLSDALREFQAKVNPFSAEWGLPAVLKKLSPFGLGMGKGFEALRADFEKRLEPEMRKFLQTASRHALARMADMLVAKWDEPSFVALRKELARWALAQPARDAARAAPVDVLAEGQAAALDVVHALLVDPALRARRRELVRSALAARAGLTVRAALAAVGIAPEIDAAALADLVWPAVRAALGAPEVRRFFTSLVDDFYDEELARAAAPSTPAPG
ncbi:MAG TPA: hypothetical protein VHB21_21855 [Minicystis sp.]|nr:hypothetical protein [Minicystis sp.]